MVRLLHLSQTGCQMLFCVFFLVNHAHRVCKLLVTVLETDIRLCFLSHFHKTLALDLYLL